MISVGLGAANPFRKTPVLCIRLSSRSNPALVNSLVNIFDKRCFWSRKVRTVGRRNADPFVDIVNNNSAIRRQLAKKIAQIPIDPSIGIKNQQIDFV